MIEVGTHAVTPAGIVQAWSVVMLKFAARIEQRTRVAPAAVLLVVCAPPLPNCAEADESPSQMAKSNVNMLRIRSPRRAGNLVAGCGRDDRDCVIYPKSKRRGVAR